MISVRFESDVARQAGKAARAAATAASTSAAQAKSTSRAWRPVAGSKTGPRRPGRAGDAAAADPVLDAVVSAGAGCGRLRAPWGSTTWVMSGSPHGARCMARRDARDRAPRIPRWR